MSTQTEPKLVTQIDFARAGQITPQMKEVAEREHRDPEYIRERVADGRIAIPANIVHIKKGMRAFGVGEGLSTKVNVNLGISGDKADAAEEWKKVKIAEDFGADAIMDLSNSGKTRQFRQQLIDETPLMVGTVPMYDAIGYMEKPLVKLTKDDLLEVVRAHADVFKVTPEPLSIIRFWKWRFKRRLHTILQLCLLPNQPFFYFFKGFFTSFIIYQHQ